MKYIKHNVVVFAALLIALNSFGQSDTTVRAHILTADSLASGNYKDVLTSFFQLAFNNLTSSRKSVEFASNPFAILARANPGILTDTNYLRYRHLRDLNLNVGVYLDSAYRLNGFSAGVKYSIINKRDVSIANTFVAENIKAMEEYARFNNIIGAWVSQNISANRDLAQKLNTQVNKWENDDAFTFNSLDEDVRTAVMSIVNDHATELPGLKNLLASDPNLAFKKVTDSVYNEIKGQWQNKPLWTIGASGAFTSRKTASTNLGPENIAISSQFLAGLNSPKQKIKWDLDILANYTLNRDTTYLAGNTMISMFEFRPGFNFVFKSKPRNGVGRPFLEFKVSGSYYHIFSTVAPGGKADSNSINGELRLRVYDDIWVPVTIKYDPENNNLLGFLSVHANFTALQGVINKLYGK